MAGFAVSFFGTQIFAALSMPVPQFVNYMQENKGTAIMGFFLGNMVISGLIATNAFEVYLGGELVHSKIKTGVLPDIHWLVKELVSRNPVLDQAAPK
mmetsp:Transcript_6251/g.14383  ORF Transcript_6251/g.14383 Transcript_6251/m.14383 type:complete len:97 (+) Transcript_6251:335-625(+)